MWCSVDVMSTGPPSLVAAACARAPHPGWVARQIAQLQLVLGPRKLRCLSMVCTGPGA